jgi:membrane-associated protease RseP (regulator of RpoE activity)
MRQPWKHLTAIGLAALFALTIAAPTTHAATSSSGWLGVYTQSLNEGLRSGIGYNGDGVLVSGVESDSPAEKAGIKKGDVITAFNSRTVNSPSALSDVVAAGKPGQSVSLGLWRNGSRQSVTVKLGERPADADTPEPGGMSWDDDDAPTPPTPPAPPDAPETYWMGRAKEMKNLAVEMAGLKPRLGVSVQDLGRELGDYFGVTDGKGILVTAVTDDTPAAKSGFKAGDVIVKVGDRSVEDSADLRAALRDRPAGKVDVTVMRKGQRMTLTPELAERPKETTMYGMPGDIHMRHTGPGTWTYMGPNGEKRITIHRSGDDDGDLHIVTPRGSHRVIVGDGDDDSKDQAEMQRQIDELKQEIDALKGQLQSSKTAPKSTTSKTTTKKTP